LAIVYSKTGRYDLAEQFFKDCLQKSEEVLGSKHPATVDRRECLALFYEEQGKHDLASQLRSQS